MISDNIKGAGLMVFSMAGYTLNDSMMKIVGTDMELFQAIFVRGIFATSLIGLLTWWAGAFARRVQMADMRRIGIRAFAEVVATVCFLTALMNMPIANISAILQTLPLTVTLAAFFLYGERFRWHRGISILIGFAGVMLIVRPGTDGFTGYSLLGLLAVAFITLRDMSARNLSVSVSTMMVTFITSLVITVAAGAMVLWLNSWTALEPGQAARLLLAALFLFVGYYCAVAAMRVGDVSFVSPFRYTALVWAILLGWFVFGDIPDTWASIGMAVVAGAGIYTWMRERKVGTDS